MQTILDGVPGCRHLTEDDREVALDVLERGLREVPIYSWLLGADSPPEVYRWYGRVIFEENLRYLYGVFESDALIALALVTDPEKPSAAEPVSDELMMLNRRYATSVDGFPKRFHELREVGADAEVPGAIDVTLELVLPEYRRRGISARFLDAAREAGRRMGVPVTGSTTHLHMSKFYSERYAPIHAEFTLTDGPTVWVHRWDPPSPTTVG